jgi:hypothetical protein
MLNAKAAFLRNVADARNLSGLYDYLTSTVSVPFPFDDLLRAQIVYTLSAYDKLVHDVIRIGMVQIFTGRRPATDRYLAETLTMEVHSRLVGASIPPKEIIFEREVFRKLSFLSFQDPQKLVHGLALIWPEQQKWSRIAAVLNITTEDARTKMNLVATRRNAIVHEADIDFLTFSKRPISRAECNDITKFVEDCGNAIVSLVN